MPIQKYSSFLQVNPSFESVVDIGADARNKDLWREYIVGEDMEKLVDFLCLTLNFETPDARRCGFMALMVPVRAMQPFS